MGKFEKYLSEDIILEMSTIHPEEHNFGVDIKLNILQPGDKSLSHGPRIKCIKSNVGKDFSITLNQDPTKIRIIGNYKNLLSTKEVNHLIDMVTFYRIPFLNMWYNRYMSVIELKQQMKQIDDGLSIELSRP